MEVIVLNKFIKEKCSSTGAKVHSFLCLIDLRDDEFGIKCGLGVDDYLKIDSCLQWKITVLVSNSSSALSSSVIDARINGFVIRLWLYGNHLRSATAFLLLFTLAKLHCCA